METLSQDLRYALRMLVKTPAFTAVAIVTLALGIGANTAIFTLVNALLLKMLPIKAPQELVVVGDPARVNDRSSGTPQLDVFSYPLYKELRDNNTVFSGLVAGGTEHRIDVDASAAGGTSNERIAGRLVSGNYFPVLGVEASAGRLLTESDDTAENANPVVVLSYGYWNRKFALSPAIIGKQIRLNGFPFTVVGVAQQTFRGDVVGDDLEVFVPISMQPEIIRGLSLRNNANFSWLSLLGRLKPSVSAGQAKANVNLVFRQAMKSGYGAKLSADDRNAIQNGQIRVEPGGRWIICLPRRIQHALTSLDGNRRTRLGYRMRERRQPSVGSRHGEKQRSCGALGHWGQSQTITAAVAHRECLVGFPRRNFRRATLGLGRAPSHQDLWFRRIVVASFARPPAPVVHDSRLLADRNLVWTRARAAQSQDTSEFHFERCSGRGAGISLPLRVGKRTRRRSGRTLATGALRCQPAGPESAKTYDARPRL